MIKTKNFFSSDFLKTKEPGEVKKALHFTLIDPEDQTAEEAGERAKLSESYGTDAIMIGGSTVRDKKKVDSTVKAIKEKTNTPTILFPNSADSVSERADYIFFMSLLNSKDHRFFAGEQVRGARFIKDSNLKPISMAYVIISTSGEPTQVEKAVDLDMIKPADIEKAVSYAITAENFGMDCIYLEAGSGAEKPVPNEMISAVRKAVSIPIIVGGGIRNGSVAKEKVDSGADAIVTGTVAEEDSEKLKEIIWAIKKER